MRYNVKSCFQIQYMKCMQIDPPIQNLLIPLPGKCVRHGTQSFLQKYSTIHVVGLLVIWYEDISKDTSCFNTNRFDQGINSLT